ncbi:MAG: apolipoprotein N-acyltransferase [Candidatus Korobacteraceae bacterium]
MNTTLTHRGEARVSHRRRLVSSLRQLTRLHKSAWLLVLSSAILQVLVFPKPGLYYLSWVCLAPLIYAVLRAREADAAELLAEETFSYLAPASVGQAFLLGWVCGTVVYLGSCYWVFSVMHYYGGLSRAVSAVLLLLFSLYVGLHQAVFAALVAWAARARAGYSRRALFLAPFLWVAVELLRTYLVGFPWDLLGTTQVANTALSRIATLTGVYGLSFEIALVNAAFAAAFLVRPPRRRLMLAATLATAVFLQLTQYIELDRLPVDSHALLVQQNVPIRESWQSAEYNGLLQSLDAISTIPPGSAKVNLIVWPESPAPFFLNDDRFVSTISAIARRTNDFVVAGSLGVRPAAGGENLLYNSAALVNPQGQIAARYDKVHLVPFGEYIPLQRLLSFAQSLTREVGTFARGSDRWPLDAGAAKLGVFICYESVFPGEVRQFADHGAQVFVNISNDGWFGNSGAPEQHLNVARMRAIENERWLLRATNTGITASIDPFGRVVAQAPTGTRTTLLAPYSLRAETTFYTRYGDWFPCLCAIISLVGLLFRRRLGAHMTQPQPV